jgi:group I intron endonuclease
MGLIYKIDSPTGRRYVGQTRKTAELRIIQYKSKRSKKNKSLILLSIDKYGWDALSFSVIEDNVPDELLNEREIYWITELKTYAAENLDGMNLTRGGDNRESWKNDKTRVERAKMRRGEKSPSWGKKWSEEMKKRIGESVSRYNKANGKKPSAECHKKAKEKQYVPVVVYDRNGDFVAEYPYLKAAAEALGLSRKCVVDATNGKQKHAGGFFFRRKREGYPLKIDVSGIKLQVKKRAVICYAGEDVIEYANPNEAAKALGLWHQTIKDSANLNKPLRNGYRFVYKDSLIKNRPRIAGRAA